MGVGIASSSWTNVTYIVCNYKPKGNAKGEYKKNVLPVAPLEKGNDSCKKRTSLERAKADAPSVE